METKENSIKPTVLDFNDIATMVPKLRDKEKLVNMVMRLFKVDKVNWIHSHNCHNTGHKFTEGVLNDLDIKLQIDNEEILDNL